MSAGAGLASLRDAFDARNRRERVLLAIAAAVALSLAWDLALRGPGSARRAAALERIERTRADIERLEAAARELAPKLEAGADADRAAAALEERLRAVDRRLADRTLRIVSPDQMADLLRDVLAAEKRLTLVALENLGVEPVIAEDVLSDDDPQRIASGERQRIPRVFRHRVELAVEGDYFALLDYLERLEGLKWRFQWDALRIETVDYPTARATLSLSTLSLAEAWIGV